MNEPHWVPLSSFMHCIGLVIKQTTKPWLYCCCGIKTNSIKLGAAEAVVFHVIFEPFFTGDMINMYLHFMLYCPQFANLEGKKEKI